MKRKIFIWSGSGILGFFLVFLAAAFISLPRLDFSNQSVQSLRIIDRNGILLREYLNDQQGRGEWKSLASISPALRKATIAVEDKRFYSHFGIDPIAIVRSIIDDIADPAV